MKFSGSESHPIQAQWLSKGMRKIKNQPDVFTAKHGNASEVFGLTGQQVRSIRYWLKTTGLSEENRSGQYLTDLGKIISREDPYFEEDGTVALLHYQIASNCENATAWYFMFNVFEQNVFRKNDFVEALHSCSGCDDYKKIESDFRCILKTYLRDDYTAKISPEDSISPLTRLGLICRYSNGSYTIKKLPPGKLDLWIALAVIIDIAGGRRKFNLSEITTNAGSLAVVFNLTWDATTEIVERLRRSGEIKVEREAGLETVTLLKIYSFEECVQKYYDKLEGRQYD